MQTAKQEQAEHNVQGLQVARGQDDLGLRKEAWQAQSKSYWSDLNTDKEKLQDSWVQQHRYDLIEKIIDAEKR